MALEKGLRRVGKVFYALVLMPKHKTRKAIMARFKVTGTGKAMRRTPGRRHLLRYKSPSALAASGKDKAAHSSVVAYLKLCKPKAF
jgi:large subunit ribosomal protein L35